LCQGFTGTLFDHVVQYRNHKDARNGIYLETLARQQKETALRAIASNEQYIVGIMSLQAGTCWFLKWSMTSWKGRGMRKKCRVSKRIRK
jgi:hypothetical protein